MSKKKIIIIAVLLLALVFILVACTAKCGNDKTNSSEIEVEDVSLDDGDPDAWWKSYVQGERDTATKNTTISWDPVAGAESYNVYRATSENGDYEFVANVKGTEYTDKTNIGQKYYYKTTVVKTVTVTKTNGNEEKVTEEVTMAEELTTKVVEVTVPATTSPVTTAPASNVSTTVPSTSSEESTTKPEAESTTEATTKPTTEPTTESTTKPIPSAPSISTKSTKIKNCDAKFIANVKSASSTKDLATACSKASGISAGVTSIKVGGSIPSLTNKKISGYDECYRFTKEVTSTNINALVGNVRYAGYIFKVSDGVDPASFAESLLSGTASRYSLTLQYFNINYKVVDYYDNYVFYMVSYD